MNIDRELVLVSARKSRGSNHWGNDDYDVRRVHTRGAGRRTHFQVNRGADYDPLVLDDHQTEALEIDRTWLCRDAGSRDGCIGGSGRCNAIKPTASFGAASWLPIANSERDVP
jgi:hypothetical protein